MFRYVLAALSALPVLVTALDHTVVVGGTSLLFSPQFVFANPGDNVIFSFRAKNHSVVESTFNSPCSPLAGGQSTSFHPVDATATSGFPTFSIPIADQKPMWFYCSQASHCQSGMLFAVNPIIDEDGVNTFNQFKALAQSKGSPLPTQASGSPSTVTVTLIQSATSTSAPTSTPTTVPAGGRNIAVSVGQTGLTYTPSNITASVGDKVTFTFAKGNHTITQSSFNDPCRKLSATSTTGQAGFDSGFMFVGATGALPSFTVQVNDTAPIYAYCRQANHCGTGMVFTINTVETSDKSFTAFQARAKALNGTSTTPPSVGAGEKRTASATAGSMTVAAVVFLVFGLRV